LPFADETVKKGTGKRTFAWENGGKREDDQALEGLGNLRV
jgi:hypothetical protein